MGWSLGLQRHLSTSTLKKKKIRLFVPACVWEPYVSQPQAENASVDGKHECGRYNLSVEQ
jgi:hypothetical protein